MRTYIITLLVLSSTPYFASTQVRYTGADYRDYTTWMKQYGQAATPIVAGAELVTFQEDAPLRRAPLGDAPIIMKLHAGQLVKNIPLAEAERTIATQNGYRDHWLLVEACDADNNHYTGYVWGGYLAKNHQYFDLDGDGHRELIALGLSQQARRAPEDIRAALRIIEGGRVTDELELEGLCLFEDCAASSLLRVFDFGTTQSTVVFEAGIFSEGCLSGIDKVLIAWERDDLRLIHRAEYTTGHTYESNPLYLRETSQTQVCYYKSENEDYDPVWNCRTLEGGAVVP